MQVRLRSIDIQIIGFTVGFKKDTHAPKNIHFEQKTFNLNQGFLVRKKTEIMIYEYKTEPKILDRKSQKSQKIH